MTTGDTHHGKRDSLHDPQVAGTLDRLHAAARRDWRQFLQIAPKVLRSAFSGGGFMKALTPADMAAAYIPVSRDQGRLLYLTARAVNAQRIVEFGASFGISTIYLGAAARDNGGTVTSTELEPTKCLAARENLAEAGLAGVAEILEGDALETLADVEGPIDFIFLDGWKDLYVPVLELLTPQLAPRAVVFADNVNFPDTKPYLAHVRDPANGFVTATVSMKGKTEISIYQPE